MAVADQIVLLGYLALIIGLGVAFRGQKSLKEFFLGGNRIPWQAAAMSGIATMLSAVGYIGAPGQAYGGDWTYLQLRVAYPGALLIAWFFFLPFFYKLHVYSAYEYLELRFDRKTRLLAATLFVFLKLFYAGVGIYAPALIVVEMTGLPFWAVVAAIGLLTTAYTTMGGIRAVIWTDAAQFFVLTGGLFAALWFVLDKVDGGLVGAVNGALAADKLKFWNFSPDFHTEFTVWGAFFGGTFLLLSQYAADQSEVQRFLTTKDLRGSRLALGWSLGINALYGIILFFIGTALWVYHQQSPPPGLAPAPDQAFPRFILEEFPNGWRGLLIAGVFAAAMSTISSVLNSLATVFLRDFYRPILGRDGSVKLARQMTVVFGLAATGISLYTDSFGDILVAAGKIRNFFGGSLVGAFLLGIFFRRANGFGAFWGIVAGFAAVAALGSATNVSWLWYSVISTVVSVGVGLWLSGSAPAPAAEQLNGLTWSDRKAQHAAAAD